MKWVSKYSHPEAWTFDIETEEGIEYPANKKVVHYRLNAYGHPSGRTMHYSYEHFEDAKAHAEDDWGVPLDSWAQADE